MDSGTFARVQRIDLEAQLNTYQRLGYFHWEWTPYTHQDDGMVDILPAEGRDGPRMRLEYTEARLFLAGIATAHTHWIAAAEEVAS